jgi:hypothetical protein
LWPGWLASERAEAQRPNIPAPVYFYQPPNYRGGAKMVSSGQIKEVHFERVFNLGNYESFRIGLTATVGPKQTAEEVVVMLDEFTIKLRNKRVKEKG